ncbi:hypothetical protein MGAST_12650 [Mycobacterium gastri 'Wayne']|nr:hypothetical protein MGAST_12650 [Mycobacterium gastri 'Wayne']
MLRADSLSLDRLRRLRTPDGVDHAVGDRSSPVFLPHLGGST